MSQKEIAKSLDLLEKDWDIDPIIKDFHLQKRDDVSENIIKIKDVIFHIPYLSKEKKFILWKCYWPDCSNCCTRQGRLSLTTINLKRKQDEKESDDGTHIKCRFLDEEGACNIHPTRPGVCYLYPFSTWLQNEKGVARVHATFQFTGDCPGFYLDNSIDPMKETLQEYAEIIYDYNFKSSSTVREGFSSISLG